MIVCDVCKTVDKSASNCHVDIIKEETYKGKHRERVVKRLDIHLYEDCIVPYISLVANCVSKKDK